MGACLGKQHEIGWEVEFDVAGITVEEMMAAFHEPDQKKMNEIWGRVGMKGMHSVKKVQESVDGHLGGKGTVYENFDRKGVKQTRHEIIHYEIQNDGKTIYTEGVNTFAGPGVPFKARDEDVQRTTMTNLDNGNVRCFMECTGLIEMRGFCGCCMKMMYPMAKFQNAIQQVIAPKGDASGVKRGKLMMKKEMTYKTSRHILAPLSPVKADNVEITKTLENAV